MSGDLQSQQYVDGGYRRDEQEHSAAIRQVTGNNCFGLGLFTMNFICKILRRTATNRIQVLKILQDEIVDRFLRRRLR